MNEYILYNHDLPPNIYDNTRFHNLVDAFQHIDYLQEKKLLNKFELVNQDNRVVWSDYAKIDPTACSGILDFGSFKNPYEVEND